MNQARNHNKIKLLAEIGKAAESHHRFVLLSHEEPDGDAIGSQVALSLALKQLGKEVASFRIDPVPPFLGFLNRDGLIEEFRPERDRERVRSGEVMIILDCSDYFRLGELCEVARTSPALKINIDHHRDNAFFGDINFVRFIAGGTAEMVFEVVRSLGVPVKGTIAEALYVGLSTDTVDFRYIDPDGNMIGIIAELIKGGISIEELQEKTYCNRPDSYLEDMFRLLKRVRYENSRALAWLVMPKSGHLTFYERELASEVLKQLLSIRNIRAAVMLHEEKAGIEVWLRSKMDVDVGAAAQKLGGGGHRTASGVLIRGMKLEEAVPLVLNAVKAEMQQMEFSQGDKS